ncbi:SHOCT domain-containing protein [Halorussus halobius]|uniref:SHOCT domain-containing protein n=1 Tax=Halorussus halobius TaxID=1710537 RepID=UPI00109262EB|nr:SHOCT domain-containing protein [Halorussus halobius]
MPLFGGSTEPGADVFRECPECGKDEIYSQSDGFLSTTEYLCNHCGYEAGINEVTKSFSETYKAHKKKNRKEINGELEEISDPELRQQVMDRQTEGWEIEEITGSGERVVMIATEGGTIGGHALTGVLTGLWTFGMGNVAYGKLSEKKNQERIVLRTDDESNSPTQSSNTENPIELIRELEELHEEGLITDAEFEEKKQELLEEV